MIAMITWQGTWVPPTMTDDVRNQFIIVLKHRGVNRVASQLLPFPWHLIVGYLVVAVLSGALAGPIGNYGDENHISIASGAAVALGILSFCLLLSSVMVCFKHVVNMVKVRIWLRSLISEQQSFERNHMYSKPSNTTKAH